MALNSVFNIGVNGLIAQSNKINAISDNIANVSTVGYKGATTDFLSLFQNGLSTGVDTRGGARASTYQMNSKQGTINPGTQTTDISISGNGFFVVTGDTSDDSSLLFTRAGSFLPDKDGNLRNSSGFYLRGWPLDTLGSLPAGLIGSTYDSSLALSSLSLVNISAADSAPVATTSVSIKANLKATQSLYSPTGNITFANNPTPGDTITINGQLWTFVASGATGNQTNIGLDMDTTLQQLIADLNASTDALITPAEYSTTQLTLSGISHPGGQNTFTDNPVAGDTVDINGVTWTFVASGATGNQSNIGIDLNSTLSQLILNLNNSGDVALTPASHVFVPFQQVNAAYDVLNGAAASFTLASSNASSTVTPLLLYDPTLATSRLANGTIPAQYAATITLVDNNGMNHDVNVSFLKTDINTWAVEVHGSTSDVTTIDGQLASGTIVFNGDGTLASVSPSLSSAITFPWATTGTIPTGATTATTDNVVTINWGTAGIVGVGLTDGFRQFGDNYSLDSVTQNGHQAGALSRIEITNDGTVVSYYNNGAQQALFIIPLAKFQNPEGLNSIAGTAYAESDTSGFTNLFSVSQGGVGGIVPGALESSTVDLSTQLTDMIIAQRAYQSNTKSLTTSDSMLETLSQMVR